MSTIAARLPSGTGMVVRVLACIVFCLAVYNACAGSLA
jgi:hypothetical protein